MFMLSRQSTIHNYVINLFLEELPHPSETINEHLKYINNGDGSIGPFQLCYFTILTQRLREAQASCYNAYKYTVYVQASIGG